MKCSCDQNQMSKRCNWWTTDRLNKIISWILIHRYKPCKHDKHSNHSVNNSSVTPEQCCQKLPQKRDLCITFNAASYEPPWTCEVMLWYFGWCWNTSQKVWTFQRNELFIARFFHFLFILEELWLRNSRRLWVQRFSPLPYIQVWSPCGTDWIFSSQQMLAKS